jgi:hypothetical protein
MLTLQLSQIFECDPMKPRRVKGKKILSELQQKTAVYQSMRGMRAPVVMDKHLGQRPPRVADSSNNSRKTSESGLVWLNPPRDPEQLSYDPRAMSMSQSPEPAPFVGKVPVPQDVVFAGVSNGESLWALPNQQSPEASSDTTSVSGQHSVPVPEGPRPDDLMADIDWVSLILWYSALGKSC